MGPKQIRQITPVLIASPPGVSDDALQNYKVGSLVYSISDQTFYECSDATAGAAVWGAVSFGGSGLTASYNTTPQALTSAVETAITNLSVSVAANKKYLVEIAIISECSGTGGINYGYTMPAGSTLKLTHWGRGSASNTSQMLGSLYAATAATGLIGNNFNAVASATGNYNTSHLLVTTNAGTFQVTFASVSGIQTSTIREYSHITLIEIP